MRRARAALLFAALALGAALFFPATPWDAPYGAGLGDRISRIYTGVTLHAWREDGPLAHAFQWQLLRDPEAPGAAAPYINHPPLMLWWHYAAERTLGPSDSSMRIAAGLWTLFGALALAGLAIGPRGSSEREQRAIVGRIAAGLCLTTGAITACGDLACPPLFGLPWMTLLAVLAARWHENPTRTLGRSMVLVAGLAGLSDWNAWPLVLLVALDLVIFGPRATGARTLALRLIAALVIALAIWLESAWIACGGGVGLLRALREVAAVVEGGAGSWLEVLQRYAQELGRHFGWHFALAAGLAALLPMDRVIRRATWLLLCGAILALAVLHSRASIHPFWIAILAPGLALGVAALFPRFFDHSERPPRWLLQRAAPWLVLAALVVDGLERGRAIDRMEGQNHDLALASALDAAFGPRDLVLGTDFTFASVRKDARVTVLPDLRSRERLDAALDRYGAEQLRALNRIVIAVYGGLAIVPGRPELAWVQELPRRVGSERDLEAPVPLGVFVLDKERFLAERRAAGRP